MKNGEALLVARKETGSDVNAKKSKFMVLSRDQNAGQNINIKIDLMFMGPCIILIAE